MIPEESIVQARAAMLRDVMAIASKGPSPTGPPPPKKARNAKPLKGSAGAHPTRALPYDPVFCVALRAFWLRSLPVAVG